MPSKQILHRSGQNRRLDIGRHHDRHLDQQQQDQRAEVDVAEGGKNVAMGRKAGSVMRYRKSPMLQTMRLRVSMTPKEASVLKIAARSTAHQ
jgi:hypothetical protein